MQKELLISTILEVI